MITCEHGHCYAELPAVTLRDVFKGYQLCPRPHAHHPRYLSDSEKEQVIAAADERLAALTEAVLMLGAALQPVPMDQKPTQGQWNALVEWLKP